jgi:hypothetical protein
MPFRGLRKFFANFGARPNLAAYIESSRYQPYAHSSMGRFGNMHNPENKVPFRTLTQQWADDDKKEQQM